MVLYNASPKKEYERIFMYKMAKDIWQSLLITYQGNSQAKDNKVDLLVQQYEQFTILEEEAIDSSFARFNTIITSLKALDEGFSSKNYVRKYLRDLHPKWRAKVMEIEESKKNFITSSRRAYRKSKTKKESSDDKTSTSGSDDEEYSMAVRNFKKFFRRNEVVTFEEQSDDLKKKLAKNNEAKMVLYNALPKKEYERIFMYKTAKDIWQSLLITYQGNIQAKDNKVDLLVQQYEQFTILEEEAIDSSFARFNTIITSLKALNEGFSSKNYVRKYLRDLHPKWRAKVMEIEESKKTSSLALDELIENLKKLERSKEIEIACKSCDELKSENAKLKETQVNFVKFDKSANSIREMLNNQKSPSCKIGLGFDSDKASTSETKTMSFVGSSAEKATDGSTIKGHGSTLPRSVSRKDDQKGTEHVFSPHLSSRSDFVITRKKLIHNSIDESKKPSLKSSLKSGIDGIFFNQSKYVKEMLKKFGLEDSKPTKTPMSTKIKLTKDDEADFVDSSKYQGMNGSLLYLTASRPDIMFSVCLCARFQENPKITHLEAVKRIFRYIRETSHLGLWYSKGTRIETVVYPDSDHAGDYVDPKALVAFLHSWDVV
nr:uncharacterized mitochondrial protein AtMg00810-like [Tanacetum cinerariifolium]